MLEIRQVGLEPKIKLYKEQLRELLRYRFILKRMANGTGYEIDGKSVSELLSDIEGYSGTGRVIKFGAEDGELGRVVDQTMKIQADLEFSVAKTKQGDELYPKELDAFAAMTMLSILMQMYYLEGGIHF